MEQQALLGHIADEMGTLQIGSDMGVGHGAGGPQTEPPDLGHREVVEEGCLLGRQRAELILDPDAFYILVSQEAVHVPPDYAAEMTPFDPLVGEFRVHYAGFFDPGFGDVAMKGEGSRAVLEVRGRDVPFLMQDGQDAAKLVFEPLTARPQRLYGAEGSHYQSQGLKLSKHFKAWRA